MNKIVYLALLISTLACGAQSNLPAAVDTQPVIEISTAVTATPEAAQIVGSWNIRRTPGGISFTTLTDVEVTLYDCKSHAGGVWCFVEYQGIRGWVNKRGLK